MIRSTLFALITLSAAASLSAQEELGIKLGAKAPDAVVQTLEGKDAKLSTYLGKGPVVLEFWATWCENCKELEPQVLSLAKQYAGKVTFVGVAVSVNQSAARVQTYAAKHAFTWPVFFDTHGAASEAYDVPATSYVVVVNAAGIVVYTGLGGDQDLAKAIRKAL
jgi:thiol-disulfide isomerase/thioredoxin